MIFPRINLERIAGKKILEAYGVPSMRSDVLNCEYFSEISILFENIDDYLIVAGNFEFEDDLESNFQLDLRWNVRRSDNYPSFGIKQKYHKYLYSELGKVISYEFEVVKPFSNSLVESVSMNIQAEAGAMIIYGHGPPPTLILKVQT